MKGTITIPGSWDGFICIEEQAMHEGLPACIELQAAIDAGAWRKHGKGRVLTIEISTEAQILALAEEAEYQNEYWNTDKYGVKEAGSSSPARGRAAKVVRERVAALLQEVMA